MTAEPDFRSTTSDGVLTITLSAVSTRNALTRATRVALVDALAEADADADVRAIILTGDDPAFSSGVNAKELLGDPDYVAPPVDPATRLRGMATPTIAAVNGSCVSGGLEIAIACSFIIASDRATFADTHAKIGISPGWALSADLPAAIGIARARQLSITGLPIPAATALAWGLVNEVTPHDGLLARATELATAIAGMPQRAVENMVHLYAARQESILGASRRLERETTASWSVDRDSSQRHFASGQSVSPPST